MTMSSLFVACSIAIAFVNSGQVQRMKAHSSWLSAFSLDKKWSDSASGQSVQKFGSAVAIDENNNVLVLHRGSSINQKDIANSSYIIKEDVILILSALTGKILATWGSNKFVKPHGLTISRKDIFITDVKLHQVFKFLHDPSTGLWKNDAAIELGEKFVPGDSHYHFCSPTDVAVLSSTEDFFVADGYCNSRIVKFDKYGLYRSEFGAGASSSFPGGFITEFNVTHSVAIAEVSMINCHNNNTSQLIPLIFVADRNNGRIQSFLENGTFLYEITYEKFGNTNKEMLFSVAFSPAKLICSSEEPFGTLYAIIGHLPVGESKIFEILVGEKGYHLRGSFAFTNVSTISNQPQDNMNMTNGVTQRIESPHAIAVTTMGNVIYVVEAYRNLNIRKFERISKTSAGAQTLTSVQQSCYFNFIVILISATFTL